MTEVTVISPNIVELVGTLQKQFGAPRTENPLPRPPVQTASGDAAGNRSGRRAGGDTPPASSALRRSQVSERQPEQLSRPPPFPAGTPTDQPAIHAIPDPVDRATKRRCIGCEQCRFGPAPGSRDCRLSARQWRPGPFTIRYCLPVTPCRRNCLTSARERASVVPEPSTTETPWPAPPSGQWYFPMP